jgi:flagellar hook-basal body complex protein FliE
MPIDPSFAVSGADWQVGSVGGVEGAQPPDSGSGSDSGFGGMLAKQVGALDGIQQDAATAAQDLATGAASDPATAVMSIERARLAMQLASQIRTKGVEALQDVFHTQV